jgi:hypothetical protein
VGISISEDYTTFMFCAGMEAVFFEATITAHQAAQCCNSDQWFPNSFSLGIVDVNIKLRIPVFKKSKEYGLAIFKHNYQ